MIELTENTIGVWYLQVAQDQDWMAHLAYSDTPGQIDLTYRHRYYADDKAFDSDDRKSWHSGTAQCTRDEAVESMREVVAMMMLAGATGPHYELLNDDGIEDFMKCFLDAPFAFVKQVSKDEYDAIKQDAPAESKDVLAQA